MAYFFLQDIYVHCCAYSKESQVKTFSDSAVSARGRVGRKNFVGGKILITTYYKFKFWIIEV